MVESLLSIVPGRLNQTLLIITLLCAAHCKSWNTFWDVEDRTAPDKISFGSQSLIKLIPGVAVNFVPNVTGSVKVWKLTPNLPAGLNFNTSTGTISGAPTVSPFALTTYALTASNDYGSASYSFQLSILATGDNIWTVFSGVSGANTRGTEGSLIFDPATQTLVVAGTTTGNLEGETYIGGALIAGFVSKFTTSGTRVFTRLSGISGANTAPAGARVDGSGNIYVAGTTNGSLDGNAIGGASNQQYLMKYDSNGNKQWTRGRVAGATYTTGTGVAVDSAGNSYVSGYMTGGTFDSITNTANTENALIYVRHDTNGNWLGSQLRAHNVFTASRGIEGYSIALDSANNVWIGGYARTNIGCPGVTAGTATPIVIKYDASATYLACASVSSGGSNNFTFGVVVDPSDNVYAAGYANFGIGGQGLTGVMDAFFIKYNSAGVVQFTRLLGVAAGTTKAYSITRSADDFYYITGETDGNLNGQTKNGIKDMFVAKYSNTGVLQWVKLMGAAGTTATGFGLAFDANNTIYVSGLSDGNYDGVTNPAAPNQSMMITRFVR